MIPTHRPRLCLGTVQTGMAYGLAGTGMPDDNQANAIFDAAKASGIRSFDTARAYGLAEQRLGRWLQATGYDCEVITKVAKLSGLSDSEAERSIAADCDMSRLQLHRDRIDGLLCHHPADILRPEVGAVLRGLRDQGRITAFGASVYTPEEADAAMAVDGLSLLQLPLSLLDQRFLRRGVVQRARDRGVQIHVRSIYTQGLLFMAPESLPGPLADAAPVLTALRAIAKHGSVSLGALALGFAGATEGIYALVVGCDRADQVISTANFFANPPPPALLQAAAEEAARLPDGLADPRTWNIS